MPVHMCANGGDLVKHHGSGDQAPLGGKFTRTRPRGEDSGAF